MSESNQPIGGEPLTHCPMCAYDLEGLPKNHVCPECGFEYDETMRIWMRSRAPQGLVSFLVRIGGVIFTIGITRRLFEGSPPTIIDGGTFAIIALIGISLYVKRRRERFLLVGKTGLVVCNYYARPRWYPWDSVERVTFGFIHAKTENAKRRREPLYPGWNVRLKERRALRRYLESVGPPEKLHIDKHP